MLVAPDWYSSTVENDGRLGSADHTTPFNTLSQSTRMAVSARAPKKLAEKLGIREGQRIILMNQPGGYLKLIGGLPRGATFQLDPDGEADFVQVFAEDAETLARGFASAKARLAKDGALWAAWRKAARETSVSLNGDQVREIGLRSGMVDVKVCSIDETWSALKFVFRAKNR